MKINILDAKNRLSQLIQSALAGEEIIIAKRGKPVVRLVPVEPEGEDRGINSVKLGLAGWLRENPLPKHLKRGHDEIEQSITKQRESWD